MPPIPSWTRIWQPKSYSAIDPYRPELSAKGKIIVITGGGSSSGRATTLAVAKQDAGQSVLLVEG